MPRTTPAPPPPLGIVLRHLREEAGWTQTALEAAAGLGPTAVTKLERGIHHLSRSETERLVRILGYPDGWVARTLAVVEQLPRFAAVEDSPAALTPAEYLAVETVAFGLSRRVAEAARADFGAALRARRWEADRKAAGKAWQRFRRQPKIERRSLVASEKDFQTWAFCERLCDESLRAAPSDADAAREIAELAVLVAEVAAGSLAWRNRLQSYALATVGYAWQVSGDFSEAERVFRRSEVLGTTGTPAVGGPLDASLPLLLHAVLLKNQQHYDNSLSLLEKGLSMRLGPLQTARFLVHKASVLEKLNRDDEALAALEAAYDPASSAADPRLLWSIDFNAVLPLCRLKRLEEATARLRRLREAAPGAARGTDLIRLRWLEARIAQGMNNADEAARSLGWVWQTFADRKLPLDAALAALELAVLELERHQLREVKRLASAASPVFAALTLPREILASARVFWEAARSEKATAETARRLISEFAMFKRGALSL